MSSVSQVGGKVDQSYIKWLFCSTEGRLNRKPYWLAAIACGVICAVVQAVLLNMGSVTMVYVSMLLSLVIFIPCIFAAIKRCHDRGRKAWFLLLGLVPILNIWVGIELAFLRGTVGDNAFGPDPLAGQ